MIEEAEKIWSDMEKEMNGRYRQEVNKEVNARVNIERKKMYDQYTEQYNKEIEKSTGKLQADFDKAVEKAVAEKMANQTPQKMDISPSQLQLVEFSGSGKRRRVGEMVGEKVGEEVGGVENTPGSIVINDSENSDEIDDCS